MVFPSIDKIYLAQGATDLRKSTHTLAMLVKAKFDLDPHDTSLYVFCNRSRTRIKALQYDKNGFWLYYKALDRGKFYWPNKSDKLMSLNQEELSWILHGLTIIDRQKMEKPILKQAY